MTRRHFALALLGSALLLGTWTAQPGQSQAKKKKIFVITHATGFKHSSRPVAASAVRFLGDATGIWEVTGVADNQEQLNAFLTPEKLKAVDLVFFANTTGDLGLNADQKKLFYDWIKEGGAYAGVHSAGDTLHNDAGYLDLVRGEFLTHGPQVKVTVYNQDPNHPATKNVPQSFEIYDEIYQYKNWERSKVHVLLSMKKHPDPAKKDEEGDFPVAWTNRSGKGRMFYTSLGHREDVYLNSLYQGHLIGGIKWALGLENGDDTPGNPIK
jgi:type 1 glutamine amidotransferase